jgi:hypothetical protein
MPGFWYSVLCARIPILGTVDESLERSSHLYWITYYRLKGWPLGSDRTETRCLFSSNLALKSYPDGDAIAWILMLRLQHQLSTCGHPYFLAHSGSRINSRDIQAYWRENAERSLSDILG